MAQFIYYKKDQLIIFINKTTLVAIIEERGEIMVRKLLTENVSVMVRGYIP